MYVYWQDAGLFVLAIFYFVNQWVKTYTTCIVSFVLRISFLLVPRRNDIGGVVDYFFSSSKATFNFKTLTFGGPNKPNKGFSV